MSLEGAQRRGNPGVVLQGDCFAALAMTEAGCHCEERSDAAISDVKLTEDCFAALAMTPRLLRLDVLREGVFIGARGVRQGALHRPGGKLVMQRHHRGVA